MNDIAAIDSALQIIRNLAIVGVGIFCLVGVDLLTGGHLMTLMGKLCNQSFDFDNFVLSGLSHLRNNTEKKVMSVDDAMQKTHARTFMGVMLLIPAVLLMVLVVTRR